MHKKVVIVDGYSFIFRAFYAIKNHLTSKDGVPTNALYGFLQSILPLRFNKEIDFFVIVFDCAKHTFRHEIYQDYKANRSPMPDDLRVQIPIIKEVCGYLGIPMLEKATFEADDVIATLATKFSQSGYIIEILSSDKDLMQVIDDNKQIFLFDAIKNKTIQEQQVLDKFGVLPKKVAYVQALIGDSVDNIPGVKGIGPKRASALINEWHDLEMLYENIDAVAPLSLRNNLINYRQQAFLSLELATLKVDLDLDLSLEQLVVQDLQHNQLLDFIQHYNFNSLKKYLAKHVELPQHHHASNIGVIVLDSITQIQDLVKRLIDDKPPSVAFYLSTLSSQLSCYVYNDQAVYVINFNQDQGLLSLSLNEIINCFKPILMDLSIKKVFLHAHLLLNIAFQQGVKVNAVEDIALLSYLVDGLIVADQSIDELLEKLIVTYQLNCDIHAYAVLCLYNQYIEQLISNHNCYLYHKVDKPLISILLKMKYYGIYLDANVLNDLSAKFSTILNDLATQIYQIVGYEFNIASTKQLGEALFVHLKLPAKKHKSGSFKTDSAILEHLQRSGYKIADLLLKWRHVAKLKSTYTDSLTQYIDANDHRVHTTFSQCVTNTGRLSSLTPNLQNIPVKTDYGKQIRSAFIAKSGYSLVSIDYSQIELRVLAVVANVSGMQRDFVANLDIHKQTAVEILQVPYTDVTTTQRNIAKTINFGIIYGQTPYGLSEYLDIAVSQAKYYMDRYFIKYPEIQDYMQQTIQYAKDHLYVKTLLNRKCFIHNINSSNMHVKNFAERAAINARIQGSAADIMRLALIAIDRHLVQLKYDANIVLQIHDEVILEVHDDQVSDVVASVIKIMESVYDLGIPLLVDHAVAKSWDKL